MRRDIRSRGAEIPARLLRENVGAVGEENENEKEEKKEEREREREKEEHGRKGETRQFLSVF